MNTTEEILLETGLDFNISKRPLFDISQGENTESGFFGIYNDKIDKCLGIVKKSYNVSQNKDIVDLTLEGIKKFDVGLTVQKGGAINDGKRVFLQLKVEGDGNVNGDLITQYITITDSNDGTAKLGVGFGDLTMSCQNQFYKFMKTSDFSFFHDTSLEEKMKRLPKLIANSLSLSYKQIELYNQLSKESIHKDLAHQLVKEMLGYDKKLTSTDDLKLLSSRALNKMENLYECIDIEMKEKGNTLWGLHSGITKFTTHKLSKPKRDNGVEESLMFGLGSKYNQKSLDFCLSMM